MKQKIKSFFALVLKVPLLEIAIVLWPLLSAYQYHFSSVGLIFVVVSLCIRLIRTKRFSFIIDKKILPFLAWSLLILLFVVISSHFNISEVKNLFSVFLYILIICFSIPVINKNKITWLFIGFGLLFALGIFVQSVQVYILKQEVRPIRILPLPLKEYYSNRFLSYQDRPMGFFMEPAAYATYAVFPMFFAIVKKRYETVIIIFFSSLLSKSTLGFIVASVLLIAFVIGILIRVKNKVTKAILFIVSILSFVGIVVVGLRFGFFEKLLSTGSSTLNRVFSGYQVFGELPFFNKIFGIPTSVLSTYLTDNSILIPQAQRVTMGFVNGYAYVLNYFGIIGIVLFAAFIILFIKDNVNKKYSLLIFATWLIMMIGDSCLFNTHFCLFIISSYLFTDYSRCLFSLKLNQKAKNKNATTEVDKSTKDATKPSKRKSVVFTGAIMIVLSILLSLLSLAKELIFAHTYGSSGEASAYTLASELPLTIFAVFAAAITSIVIPLFSKKYFSQGKKEADIFVSNLMTVFGLITLVITILIFVFANQIISLIASSWKDDQNYAGMHDVAVIVLRCSSILIICNSVIDTTTGVLNFYHKFVAPRFLTGLRNILFILSLVSFYNMFGIYAAVIGLVSGILVETIIFFIIFCRHVKYKPNFKKKDGMLREAIKIAIPILIGSGADELTGLTDKVVASSLEASAIANLSYAYKPTSIITNVIVGSVHTIAFPLMAEYSQTNEKEKMRNSLSGSFLISMLLAIPLAIGGSIISKDIVYFIYGRGALSGDYYSLNVISLLFCIYLIISFFAVARSLFIKAFYSNKNTIIPVIFVSGGLVLNTLLNCLFVFVFKLGVTYLALASLISTALSTAIIIIIFSKKYINIFNKFFVQSFIKILLSSIFMGAVVFLINIISGETGGLVQILFELLFGLISYIFLLSVFKEEYTLTIINKIKNMIIIEKPKSNGALKNEYYELVI